jgi:hypothetical protein
MGTGGPLPGVKRGQGRDADHSPPSSTEVKNEQEQYLLSTQAPSWRAAGQLYSFFNISTRCRNSSTNYQRFSISLSGQEVGSIFLWFKFEKCSG